jgi:hypothetical protein
MEPGRTIAISTLQSLIFLGRGEEKRLRLILASGPAFVLRMKTRADLERCIRKTNLAMEELAALQAKE